MSKSQDTLQLVKSTEREFKKENNSHCLVEGVDFMDL